MTRSRWRASVLACSLALLILSCSEAGDDDDDDSEADDDADDDAATPEPDIQDPLADLIQEGKECLGAGDGVCAWDAFHAALEIDPARADAGFGLALADELLVSELVRQIMYIINVLAAPADAAAMDDHRPLEFGEFFQQIIEHVLKKKSGETSDSLDLARMTERFRFYLENYPVIFNGEVLDNVQGEWDPADATLLMGPSLWLEGISGVLLSHYADCDVSVLTRLDLSGSPAEILGRIIDAMLAILTDPDYPDFLILKPEGVEILQQAGIDFGLAFLKLHEGFELVRAETDDQADDVFAYVDLNGNRAWDLGEPYKVPVFGELTPEQSELVHILERLCVNIGASFLDDTERDLNPGEPDLFLLSDLNELLVALGVLPSPILPAIPIDLGKPFREPTEDGLKNAVIQVLTMLDALFPAPDSAASQRPQVGAILDQGRRPAGPLSPNRGTNVIWADGRWFRDSQGRVVILRGPQVGNKFSPFLPWQKEADFDRLPEWGFFAIRLGIVWEAVEPQRGQYDEEFLDGIAERAAWCSERGISVILDMHQDIYARRYGGDGAPEWACLDDDIPHVMASPWYMNYFSPAVMRAFDNFWDNKDGVQDDFIAMWRHVAERLDDEPAVIGYDLMNEPFFGTTMPAYCHPFGFDHEHLQPFYERLIAAIQQGDPGSICFFEPNIMKGGGFPSFISDMGFDNVAFAPHYYEPKTSIFSYYDLNAGRIEENMRLLDAESEKMDAPWWMGEFGLFEPDTINGEQCMIDTLNAMDSRFGSWNYWEYGKWGGMNLLNPDYTETKWVDLLVRPYPVATAGVPQEMSFDVDTKAFSYNYNEDEEAEGPTMIFVPVRHYPDGFEVFCSDPAGTWSYEWDEDAQMLLLFLDRDLESHTITISQLGS